MGCLVSFLNSMRGYHGSHLSPRQLERQRKQRSHYNRQSTRRPMMPTPPSSPEEEFPRDSRGLPTLGRGLSYTASSRRKSMDATFSKH